MKSQWSHAGGVVVRTVDNELEYLLVAASDNRKVWVLPKGHIEKGETPEAAAVREVMKEAGVRVIFFLMQYTRHILTQAHPLNA